MRLVTRPPSPELAPFVSSIGYFEGRLEHARERILPSGAMQLLVNLHADELRSYTEGSETSVRHAPGAALQGAHARPVLLDTAQQRAVMWVGFRPGGAHPFFPGPASAARDQLVGLDALWGGDGVVLRERLLEAGTAAGRLRLLEAVLLARAGGSAGPDPAIAAASALLGRGAAVADVADRLGWASKRLLREFTDQVGLTPKRFARVRRFQRLLRAAAFESTRGGVCWALLAAECGYHDQAHMIHDFRTFSGLTPSEYAPRSTDAPNHVPVPG